MLLRALSDNNEFFLFEDRLHRAFRLYSIMKRHFEDAEGNKTTKCKQQDGAIDH